MFYLEKAVFADVFPVQRLPLGIGPVFIKLFDRPGRDFGSENKPLEPLNPALPALFPMRIRGGENDQNNHNENDE